jgi:hypothetical protein
MFSRLSVGWELVMRSFRVLRDDKRLIVFPLLSSIACLIVLGSFAIPLWGTPEAKMLVDSRRIPNDPLAYVLLFLFYFANYFVIVFFNSALVACAIGRFRGNNPTVGDGFRVAVARIPQIVAWSLVSATIGMILRVIESRSERVGQFVSGLLGMAWTIVTFFVVPVLVMEKANPMDAVKRSTSLLKKTWGESLTAHCGSGIIFFVVFLIALIPMAILFMLATAAMSAGLPVLAGVAVAALVILVIGISLVSATLNTIVLAALYLYAAEGAVPDSFDAEMLEGAFATK